MTKIFFMRIFFLVIAFFCSIQAKECNKQEFLNKNYLEEYDIYRDDLGFLDWIGAYQKANKIIGIIRFIECQQCAKWKSEREAREAGWKSKIIVQKEAELKKIQEYKNKVWQDEDNYNVNQRYRIMWDYRLHQQCLFQQKHESLAKAEEFKELASATHENDNDNECVNACERDNSNKAITDSIFGRDCCEWQKKNQKKSKQRKDHAVKDFEGISEAKERGIKNPFVD